VNDQSTAMLVGFGVVVGLRLLDWAFPRGYFWARVRTYSVAREELRNGKDRTPRDDDDEADEGDFRMR
jgi:hypothetical protein